MLENQLRNIKTEDERKQKEGLIVETYAVELKTAVQKISVLENELFNRENFYKQNIVTLEERSAVMEEERNKALDREVDALKRLNEVKKETEMVGNKFSAKL